MSFNSNMGETLETTPEIILPIKEDCLKYITLYTIHSCRVEYYIHNLGIKPNDPESEKPHDLAGPGNKFDWEVMRGLALNGKAKNYPQEIGRALALHRQQYHHRQFNGREYRPEVPYVDLQVGAVDTICALLDPRDFYGGKHTLEQIGKMPRILENPPHKLKVILEMVEKMKALPKPSLDHIKNLSMLPEQILGLPEEIYHKIYCLALDARTMVELKYQEIKQ